MMVFWNDWNGNPTSILQWMGTYVIEEGVVAAAVGVASAAHGVVVVVIKDAIEGIVAEGVVEPPWHSAYWHSA